MNVYMVAVIANSSISTYGFRLIDINSEEVMEVTKEQLYAAAIHGKIKVINLRIGGNGIHGSKYPLDQYETYRRDGELLGGYIHAYDRYRKVIVGVNPEDRVIKYITSEGNPEILGYNEFWKDIQYSIHLNNNIIEDNPNINRQNMLKRIIGMNERPRIANYKINETYENIDMIIEKNNYPIMSGELPEEIVKYNKKAKLLGARNIRVIADGEDIVATLDPNLQDGTGIDLIFPSSVTTLMDRGFRLGNYRNVVIDKSIKVLGKHTFRGARIENLIINIDGIIEGRTDKYGDYETYGDPFALAKIENIEIITDGRGIPKHLLYDAEIGNIKLPDNVKEMTAQSMGSILGHSIFDTKLEKIGANGLITKDRSTLKFPNTLREIGHSAIGSYYMDPIIEADYIIPEHIKIMNSEYLLQKYSKVIVNHQMKELRVHKVDRVELNVLPEKILRESLWASNLDTLMINKPTLINTWAIQRCAINKLYVDTSLIYDAEEEDGNRLMYESDINDGILVRCNIGMYVIQNNLERIGKGLSPGKVHSLKLMGDTMIVGEEAFEENEIKQLILSDKLRVIENRAFYSNKIKKLTIPSSVELIEEGSFAFNDMAELIIEPRKPREDGKPNITIRSGAFIGNNINRVVVPKDALIEKRAFDDYTEIVRK